MAYYKTELNEWCQKNKKQLPLYQSYEEDQVGQFHQFRGKCLFENETFVTKETFITKKAASNAAAKLVLDKVSTVSTVSTSLGTTTKYYLIIDLDNQNIKNCIHDLAKNENIKIIGIGGPRTIIPQIECSRFELSQTNLITKDAADIELAFKLGQLSSSLSPDTKIRVFSTDYALDALAKIMSRMGFDAKFSVNIELGLN